MDLNPATRQLREELTSLSVEYETEDYEYEVDLDDEDNDGLAFVHVESTDFIHGEHIYTAMSAYGIDYDSRRKPISRGWKFGYLELTVDDEESMLIDPSEIREILNGTE